MNSSDLTALSPAPGTAGRGDWVDRLLLAGDGADACLHLGGPVDRAAVRSLVDAAEARLTAAGLAPGGTVALRLAPSVEYIAMLLAGWRIGAQASLLDHRLTGVETDRALAVLGCQILVQAPAEPGATSPALGGFAQLTAEITALPGGRPAETGHVLIQLSSGSTGPSKVIARTSADLAAELDRYSRLPQFPGRGERIVLLSSMVHVLGLVGGLLHALHAGAELVLPERSTPAGILDAIAARPGPTAVTPAAETPAAETPTTVIPTTVIGVPFHAELLTSVQAPRPTPGLVRMIVAGELVRPGVPESFTARYGVPLGTMYGMTEVGVIATDLTGRLRPAVDPVYGLELREDDGELHIRMPDCPYLGGGRFGAVDPSRWSDGWLHTRDAARLDPDTGHVVILGRRDSQVSVGGLKVDLTEVEQTLCALAGVTQGVVVFADGAVEAYAELDPGTRGQDVRDELARRLAGYKLPRRLLVLPALPRTATGKILRDPAALRAAAQVPAGPAPDAARPGGGSRPDSTSQRADASGPVVPGATMRDQVREFIVGAISGMNYDASDVRGDTDLGPAGLGLESLALFELGVVVEEEYKIKLGEDDLGVIALMTLDEFTVAVEGRITGEDPDSAAQTVVAAAATTTTADAR